MINVVNTITELTRDVNIALDHFQLMVGRMLDEIGSPMLLSSDEEDYRIRPVPSCVALAVEIDLHLGYGAVQRLAIPSSGSGDAMQAHLDDARQKFIVILVNLDPTLAFQKKVAAEARRLIGNANRVGIRIALGQVELAPIDLVGESLAGRVVVHYEVAACHILRPVRDFWYVDSISSFRDQFVRVRKGQEPREKRLAAVGNVAVGFIDSVALAMIDTLPQPGTATCSERTERDVVDGFRLRRAVRRSASAGADGGRCSPGRRWRSMSIKASRGKRWSPRWEESRCRAEHPKPSGWTMGRSLSRRRSTAGHTRTVSRSTSADPAIQQTMRSWNRSTAACATNA